MRIIFALTCIELEYFCNNCFPLGNNDIAIFGTKGKIIES